MKRHMDVDQMINIWRFGGWSKRFGDLRQQFSVQGVHGANRSVILAGSFHGTIDFGAGALVASGYDGTHEGTEDVFLAILEEKPLR